MIIGTANSNDYLGKAEIYYSVNWLDDSGRYQVKYFEDLESATNYYEVEKEIEYDIQLVISLITNNEEDREIIDEVILKSFYVEMC